MLSEILSTIVDYVWGLPLVFLLVGGGIYLLFISRFVPLKGFSRAVKLILGKYHHEGETRAEGQLHHFQALCTALAATVGMGNIAGVAVAITQGGPGAVFWMWVAAFIGMNTKFFECSLSVMFRGKDYRGEVQGGPMYVIRAALPKKFHFLAFFFAICGLVGTLSLFQVNQLASYLHEEYSVAPIAVGIVSAIFVGYALLGGVRRLGLISSYVVPLMCFFYVVCGVVIICLQCDKVPGVFALIFKEAFSGRAAAGGAMGVAVIEVLKIGVKRASFSNEAGMGTAAMAHGNAKTSEPISEGLVAMIGPSLDTLIVCTITALIILTSLPVGMAADVSGVVLTTNAFEQALPGFGKHFLGVAILLFSITTMVGSANYNEKCWNFLFQGRKFFKESTFIGVYCLTLVVGAVAQQADVVNLLDIGFALMAFPNLLATVYLAPRVKTELQSYLKRYPLKGKA